MGSVQKRLEKIQNQLIPRAKHYIVNPELFKLNIEFYEDLEVEGLIVDESSMLKNYYSEISTDVWIFSQHLKYVYLSSGKPAPNHTLEYFPQMKVIDPKSFQCLLGNIKKCIIKKRGLYETDHKFSQKIVREK